MKEPGMMEWWGKDGSHSSMVPIFHYSRQIREINDTTAGLIIRAST
jgi:hypothetical protein